MKPRLKTWFLGVLVAGALILGCEAPVDNLTGPTSTGLNVGIKAIFGSGGLINDGASQATIRVEVFTTGGTPVDDITVDLTTTLGTLGDNQLTTVNGAANTTLTAGTTAGNAYVVATVDNASATTSVPIRSF